MLAPNPKAAPGNPGMRQAGTDKPGAIPPTVVPGWEGQEHGVGGSWLGGAGSLH